VNRGRAQRREGKKKGGERKESGKMKPKAKK
jgi:hypothetical protein